ncbi:ABC transporter ATP-binding protein [Phocoenobacter skyensis]|uniref:ABC transporter ATP-binding protein n=1 Tax=Phocoenobacter skyensis TaxID=97481 RepID=A0A1H7VPX8_9PAST|nr:ABC transporter ATP-binding protein [Pasteurella skyensis]MDP8078859.1 ABC transporter ATP-binding protein [Pasteurella skyensis]MDP8084828.1 ABC transporter ATP-binding protein [Pasteurella skyensis]MDP8184832.1 ABC transporter ATP-binding protein [Pasteurella skyensis]QLB22501.1 ABC transporter ATP-binding protein [Pasteurella skyensis]SEM10838.1 ATP-binding cassette, subfamily B [Pasteurella skyensis]
MKTKPHLLKRLTPYMGEKKYLLTTSLVLSATSATLSLLPFVFLWLIARELFASHPELSNVGWYAGGTLGSALLAMLLYFLALTSSHLAAFRAEIGMRKIGMQRIINMPLGFFDHNQSGKIRKIIDDNASQTHAFLAHQLPDLSATITAPILILILMLFIDWRMGLISLIPIVLGFIAMSLMMNQSGQEFRQKYMDHLEEMSSESVEYVRGIPVVKTFGQSVYAFTRFVDSITRYKETVYAFTLLFQKTMSFYTVIMQSAAFFLVPFTIFFISNDNLGQTLSNIVFYLLVAPNFTLLFMRNVQFQHVMSVTTQYLDNFDTILDYPEMTFVSESEMPKTFDVEFKNVVFAYDGSDRNAVDGISFTINAGETVALIGTSGGGKTTIARLLARFWDVKSGEILIGGQNIKTLSRQTLMGCIAFVFQNTKLFKLSLRDNITYGKTNASESEIDRAVDLSQSREIIDNLLEGLETQVGKDGTYLSGGEQQRIALARAILKDAPIVLLDEATAFADPENEHLIQQALQELSKGKTTLMIAHRLTTVQQADKILVIDNGKIVQSGTHSQLLAEGGLYQQMWNEYQQAIDWKLDNVGGAK